MQHTAPIGQCHIVGNFGFSIIGQHRTARDAKTIFFNHMMRETNIFQKTHNNQALLELRISKYQKK